MLERVLGIEPYNFGEAGEIFHIVLESAHDLDDPLLVELTVGLEGRNVVREGDLVS